MKYFSTFTNTSLCANFSLVQTGSDLSKLVQTGHDMSRLVQTGSPWSKLVIFFIDSGPTQIQILVGGQSVFCLHRNIFFFIWLRQLKRMIVWDPCNMRAHQGS